MCYHEAIYHRTKLNGYPIVGNSDCGYVFFPEWAEAIGEHKLVIIHRDPKEVAKSVSDIGLPDTIDYLPKMADKISELDGLHIPYDDINERLEEIHDYLGIPLDKQRAELFIDMNIQATEWSRKWAG